MARKTASGFNGATNTAVVLSAWDYMSQRPLRTLCVVLMFGFFRFLGGRDLIKGGRKTDATFFSKASRVHGSWWHSAPGYLRLVIRTLALVVLFWGATGHWAVLVVGLALAVVGGVYLGIRQMREARHHDAHLAPVWPAVAGIIGVDRSESPRAWLDVPGHLESPEDEITVGLQADSPDDDHRLDALVNLFQQRLGRAMHGTIDYQKRLVRLHLRPVEPDIWPAVALVLGVNATRELAGDWLTVSPYIENGEAPEDRDIITHLREAAAAERKANATIVVQLPPAVVDHTNIANGMTTLAHQRFGGEWTTKTDRIAGTVTVKRVPAKKTPPKHVDLFDHPGFAPEASTPSPAASTQAAPQLPELPRPRDGFGGAF